MPDPDDREVIETLAKMRAITPAEVANQFDIKVSIAKRFLKELHREERIKLVTRNRALKVYTMPG